MIYLINYTESISESRGLRNEIFLKKFNESLLISGSWSHTHKKRITSSHDSQILLKNLGYAKNIGFMRILSAWHFAFLLRRKIIKDNLEIETCIISSINLEALILLPRRYVKKVILDVRDIWPDAHKLNLKTLPFYFYCTLLNKFIKRRVSFCFYVSPSFKPWVKKNYDLKYSYYLPLCYDSLRWGNPSSKPFKISGKIKIGYIGNLNDQFSLDEIIEVVSCNNVYLEIVGGGEKINNLKKIIKKRSLDNKVLFYGYLSRIESTKIVKQWHYGVVPQTKTSKADMPNKFFDYLGAGIPIIAFDDTWLGKYIQEKELGLSISRTSHQINFKDKYSYFKKNVLLNRSNFNANLRYEEAMKSFLKLNL